MTSSSAGITDPVYRGGFGRTSVRFGCREPASEATPGPILGAYTEAGADGIIEDVLARRGEVVVAFDDPRRVAVSEEVACSSVAPVESESVDPVQPLHSRPQSLDGGLEDQVVVGRHQAEGVDDPVEAVDAIREQREEVQAVRVVAKDGATVDAACRHVKDTVRKLAAEPSCHPSRP
jgi:hypothetical protein